MSARLTRIVPAGPRYVFKNLSELASLFRHAREAAGRMEQVLSELRQLRVQGTGGGGLVTVVMRGDQQVLNLRIDEGLFARGDRELIEDLACVAMNDALAKLAEAQAQRLKELAFPGDASQVGEMLMRLLQQSPESR
ncbi:MAG: YbaB/EbfC family nucleoid-associated protein [Pirellulales bacterium]|nr:YbaB/EbfC family nucleoid-associated protein [Pirellulales bacterium]